MEYYATLGYTPTVVADIQNFASRDPRLVVFHGDLTGPQKESLAAVRTMAKSLALQIFEVEIDQPWDFAACYSTIIASHKQIGSPSDVVVNASGGTEVMNCALTLFAMLTGFRTRYIDRWTSRAVEVDFGLVRKALQQEGTRRDLLWKTFQKGGATKTKGLAQELGVTSSALSQHVQRLTSEGLLEAGGPGRKTTIESARGLWSMVELAAQSTTREGLLSRAPSVRTPLGKSGAGRAKRKPRSSRTRRG